MKTIKFNADMDFDNDTQEIVVENIENQIQKELKKIGKTTDDIKDYRFKLEVEVDLKGD
jgi:hypothetical protein